MPHEGVPEHRSQDHAASRDHVADSDSTVSEMLAAAIEQITTDHNLTPEQVRFLDSRLDVTLIIHTLKEPAAS